MTDDKPPADNMDLAQRKPSEAPDRCQFMGEIETHLGPVHRVGVIVACDRCKTAWVIVNK